MAPRNGRLDAQGGNHSRAGERAQGTQPPPEAAPGGTPHPLASRRAGIEAGHRGGNAALVDKDQLLWVDPPDPRATDRPFLLDVGAIRRAASFLRHSPSRCGARHSVGRLNRGRPLRSAKRSA
jgi:hypothetical protein